jgi:hypothetical protein
MKWSLLREIWEIYQTRRMIAADRRAGITPDLGEAMRIALERFPNDKIHQAAKAESELFMRRFRGERGHDA